MIDVEGKTLQYDEGANKEELEPMVWRDGDGRVYAIGARRKRSGPMRDVMWYWFLASDPPPGTEEEMMQLAQYLVDMCYLRRK